MLPPKKTSLKSGYVRFRKTHILLSQVHHEEFTLWELRFISIYPLDLMGFYGGLMWFNGI